MKHLVLTLALLIGGEPCQDETELHFGVTCPTIGSATIIANTVLAYNFQNHLQRSGCLVMGISGNVVAESQPFNIGNELFVFLTIQTPDGTLYQLKSLGEGYTA